VGHRANDHFSQVLHRLVSFVKIISQIALNGGLPGFSSLLFPTSA